MQEESDRIRHPGPTQFARERNQVVIMDPDDVVIPEQGQKLPREQSTDAPIRIFEASLETEEPEHVVAQRPQADIAVAVVIVVEIRLVKVDRREADIAFLRDRGARRFALA